jgi:hypothetical protein
LSATDHDAEPEATAAADDAEYTITMPRRQSRTTGRTTSHSELRAAASRPRTQGRRGDGVPRPDEEDRRVDVMRTLP